MIKFIKRRLTSIYLVLTILFITPFFFPSETKEERYSSEEQFSESLCNIKSIEAALEYVDKTSGRFEMGTFDTLSYVKAASKFTKERFFHGLSRYSISENWIANIGAKCFWDHLSAVVNPDDILGYCGGLCSQQTIVFMEVLKRRGIKTRSVGLGYKEGPGHFLCEVFYHGKWHLYDVTMEPQWIKVSLDHESMEYYQANKDSLFVAYDGRLTKSKFTRLMEKVEYGKPNDFPAKNMLMFHKVTRIITIFLPIIFGVLFLVSLKRKKSVN